jgi:hypothetical protein
LEGKYMYGLWEMDLPIGLIWRAPDASPQESSSVTRDSNRAPSWSWASIDGEIDMPDIWREVKDIKAAGFAVISHGNVSGAFDPIREKREVPTAFALVVQGFLRRVWHVPVIIDNQAGFPVVEDEVPTDKRPYSA